MLADPRSKALVENFAGQWLELRKLRAFAPDPDTFPEFDENLRERVPAETELFVESQLREDHSVRRSADRQLHVLNERLARHYGIPGVYGSRLPPRDARRPPARRPARPGQHSDA